MSGLFLVFFYEIQDIFFLNFFFFLKKALLPQEKKKKKIYKQNNSPYQLSRREAGDGINPNITLFNSPIKHWKKIIKKKKEPTVSALTLCYI